MTSFSSISICLRNLAVGNRLGAVAAEPLRLVLRGRETVIRVLLRGRTVASLKILPRRPLIRIAAAMRNTNNPHKAAAVGI